MNLALEKTYTLADYLTWDEGDHIELIAGEPVMLATPLRVHQEIVGELFGYLRDYLKGKKCKVYVAPFAVRVFERDNDLPEQVDTVVEPDISVVCDPAKLDRIGCKGAPDLIMEILSPSTRRHDKARKLNLYQRAGVKEYWIVDPDNKDVQVFLLKDGNYIIQAFGEPGDTLPVNVLPGCTIDLAAVFSE